MDTNSINTRYSTLAETTCCLSCGRAIHYAYAQPGEYCVDFGSGRGTDVLRLAEEVGENGFVYGIDISDGMLETARIQALKLKITNVAFIKCELEHTVLPGGIADLLVSNCTINHAADKTQVWNEIFRILKDGGRFVISDIYAINPVPDEYRSDPVAVSECWAGAVMREEYLQTVREAGFQEIKILEESDPYSKGRVVVASFTIFGRKINRCCS